GAFLPTGASPSGEESRERKDHAGSFDWFSSNSWELYYWSRYQVEEYGVASMDAYTRPICSLAKSLGTIGVAERGRYVWHEDEKYVRFLAEFFLRRINRTTVQRFLPSFIEAFPTFEALASAEPDSVVKVAWWAGLRRRVAKLPVIAATFLSRETWTAEELLSLPHVGRYAAEGIALYVLGEPTFPVDNNVRRVVGR